MALPINIEQLLIGKIIEWDRLEFKKGWNPAAIIETIGAFANDINDWGGGYIIVGVEEKDGMPIYPPFGLQENQLDAIQKELRELCNQIEPFYTPITQPVFFQEKWILIIWVPSGDNRPYKVPIFGKDKRKMFTVRRGSVTALANHKEELELYTLAKKIPFDDRINHQATLQNLDLGLIRDFLHEIKSTLAEEAIQMPFADLCRQMRIASGPNEYLKPLNIGLMLFCREPEKFFPSFQTDVVWYKDKNGSVFEEFIFKGPLHKQLREVLSHVRSRYLTERVIKVKGKAEAIRVNNYPYEALEEAIVNAFFHRSYEVDSPIEIRIWFNRIEILSYPGTLPPITQQDLLQRRIVARHYRNRRLGDFLKDLDLTEGRCTGFPKIYDEMAKNRSFKPVFKTDEDRSYFLATFLINPYFLELPENADDFIKILFCCKEPKTRKDILEFINLSNQTFNYENKIIPLIEQQLIEMTIPDKPQSRLQEYSITDLGLIKLQEYNDAV